MLSVRRSGVTKHAVGTEKHRNPTEVSPYGIEYVVSVDENYRARRRRQARRRLPYVRPSTNLAGFNNALLSVGGSCPRDYPAVQRVTLFTGEAVTISNEFYSRTRRISALDQVLIVSERRTRCGA